jgi:hypothetical protein
MRKEIASQSGAVEEDRSGSALGFAENRPNIVSANEKVRVATLLVLFLTLFFISRIPIYARNWDESDSNGHVWLCPAAYIRAVAPAFC